MKGRNIIFILFFTVSLMAQKQRATVNYKNVKGGYLHLKWGSDYNTIKKKIIGTIKYEEQDNKIISTKDDITYLYNFFKFTGAKQAVLYYIGIMFPMVIYDKLYPKFEKKYGKPLKMDKEDKKNGYIMWEKDDTAIFLWFVYYQDNYYINKVDYISLTLAKGIAKEIKNREVYRQKEDKIIKDLGI